MKVDVRAATLAKARQILKDNDRGGYTIPSSRLYPFQWNWDSGFIALGLCYFEPQRAMAELESLLEGQWDNGMLPHIIFHHPDADYFPGPEIWQTEKIPGSPRQVATSGITQPPVLGFILERMDAFLQRQDEEWESFLRRLFPEIVAFHRYLYTNRDPYNEGLVYIHHNWESGTDNSPVWDEILNGIDISHARDVSALRKDDRNVDASQRPTNDNYQRYIYLVDLFVRHGYNDAEIVKDCPFLVQDVLFNSLLVKSNFSLITLAKKLGFDTEELEGWNRRTIAAINHKLWDQEKSFYFAYDLKNNQRIPIKTSSGFLPLFAGICNGRQVTELTAHLVDSFIRDSYWKLCPSTSSDEAAFNPIKYWRGPVWVNMNWMLYHGLRRYGKVAEAARIRKDTLELVEEHDIFEYYDPRPDGNSLTGRGIGADTFSWTAALYLDLINNPQPF